jgi:ABC-type uncharacterized transport system involved in gliding motility auxiliary subunit
MRIDLSLRRWLWLQNLLFTLLLVAVIGLLAWLSLRYAAQADWSANRRNTLSPASQTLLTHLDGPIRVTAYARDNPALRDAIARLIGRYQRHKSDLSLNFVNPDLLPDRVRELGITLDGELYLEYRGRGEKLRHLSEQALTQALQRLSREREIILRFLDGHGERKPLGVANHDLGTFSRELQQIGIQIHALDLSMEPTIPAKTSVLVIASPQTLLPAGQVAVILDYVQQGGHLLWLREPADFSGLQALATLLGAPALPGMVIDADAMGLGINNPAFIPIADYAPHPITESLRSPALLPQAAALDLQPLPDWQATVLLESQSRSWTETAETDATLRFDPDSAERAGPLTVGVALSRSRLSSSDPTVMNEQRIVIIGDGDFLSNSYLGNGANLQLGLNMVHWLTRDDAPILIPPRIAPDPALNLSEGALALIAAVFLIGLPLALLASGWLIAFRRQRR